MNGTTDFSALNFDGLRVVGAPAYNGQNPTWVRGIEVKASGTLNYGLPFLRSNNFLMVESILVLSTLIVLWCWGTDVTKEQFRLGFLA